MESGDFRPDLLQERCSYLALSGEIEEPIEALAALLDRNRALASYRRSNTRHHVMFTLLGNGTTFRCMWLAPSENGFLIELPAKRGELWQALDLMLAEAMGRIDVECYFDIPDAQGKPLIKLPLELVETGPDGFNQIQGYRAARVEEGETLWTATLNRNTRSGGYNLEVQFTDQTGSPRDLFRRCVDVRDGLFWRGDA